MKTTFFLIRKIILNAFNIIEYPYKVVNIIYLLIAFSYALIIGRVINNYEENIIVRILIIGVVTFYGFILALNKNFQITYVYQYFPLTKVEHYLTNCLVSFIDFTFILFLTFATGLFLVIDNLYLLDFIFFTLSFLCIFITVRVFMLYNQINLKFKFLRFVIIFLVVISFYMFSTTTKVPILSLCFLLMVICSVDFSLYNTHKTKIHNKYGVQLSFFFPKYIKKYAIWLKSLYLNRLAFQKLFSSFIIKLVFMVFIAYLSNEDGSREIAAEFIVFKPFLFTPYLHATYFTNLWGFNRNTWFIMINAPYCQKTLVFYFIVNFLYVIVFDFLLTLAIFAYFQVWEIKLIALYMLSAWLSLSIFFICAFSFPIKISKASFSEQDTFSPSSLILMLLFSIMLCCFYIRFNWAIYLLVICSILTTSISFIIIKSINKLKHNVYQSLFK